MKFLFFLLLLILAPILYSIGKVWLAVRRAQKRFQETYREMQDAYRRSAGNGGGSGSATKTRKEPEGEYADFEDIESTDDSANDDSLSQQDSEPLVMEAEYEDIN